MFPKDRTRVKAQLPVVSQLELQCLRRVVFLAVWPLLSKFHFLEGGQAS